MPSAAADPSSRDGAIAALQAALADNPADDKAHIALAELFYLEGQVEAAIQHRAQAQALRGPREKKAKKRVPPKPNHITEPVYAELKRIADSDRPIFVGPWAGEVGFELLYWLPFLWRFVEDHGVDPTRLRVVSRGGTATWYEGLAAPGRYVELYGLMTPAQVSDIARDRHLATGSDKPMAITPWDHAIAERAFGAEPMEMLHPSLLYRLLAGYWRGTEPFSLYAGNAAFRRLAPPTSPLLADLPERYTAVKFYSRPSFPMNADNAAFVQAALLRLAERGPVVVLDTGVAAYSHEDYAVPRHPNIISLKAQMTPADNLHLQSCIVAAADQMVCTYGGIAYLPLLYGKPAVSFFSCEGHTLTKHSQAAYLLSEAMNAPLSILSVDAARQLL